MYRVERFDSELIRWTLTGCDSENLEPGRELHREFNDAWYPESVLVCWLASGHDELPMGEGMRPSKLG